VQLGEALSEAQRPAGSAGPPIMQNLHQQETPFNKGKLQSHDVTRHPSRNSCEWTLLLT